MLWVEADILHRNTRTATINVYRSRWCYASPASPGNAPSAASGYQQNKTPSPDASKGSPINNGRLGNGGGSAAAPLDFSDELAQKLTLKKQKQQGSIISSSSSSGSVPPAMNPPPTVPNEANLRLNRGPPPQPPTSIQRVRQKGSGLHRTVQCNDITFFPSFQPSGDNSASKTAPAPPSSSQKRCVFP